MRSYKQVKADTFGTGPSLTDMSDQQLSRLIREWSQELMQEREISPEWQRVFLDAARRLRDPDEEEKDG